MRVQRWIELLTAVDYTLEYRKGSANGKADFLSRFPQPATEHDRTWSSSLIPVEDVGIFLIGASGFRTRAPPIPGVWFEWAGSPPRERCFGWAPFCLFGLAYFRARGPCMGIDDLSAPSVIFDCNPGRELYFLAAETAFASVSAVPSWGGTVSTETPAASTRVAQYTPFTPITAQGADSTEITDQAASAPSPQGDSAAPTALQPSGRISTRTRRSSHRL